MRNVVFILALVWGGVASATPQRIISLKPNITEIVFALGAGDRVVGVTRWCNYPEAAQRLPKVADYMRPNIEVVMALQPDLVITSKENALRRPIEQLRKQGIDILLVEFATVDQTLHSIIMIGTRVGMASQASEMTTALRSLIATFHTRMIPTPMRPNVLVVVDRIPLIAAGPASFIGELLEIAGGHNVITAQQPAYPTISKEHLLALHPDITIDVTHSPSKEREIHIEWLRPGPRLSKGLYALRKAMYD